MFVDFNKVFSDKPQTELKIPDAMLDHLNSKLPQGIRYKADEHGNCEIVSDGETVKIGGLLLVPDAEQKKILGKNFTADDVLSYSYNAQKRIQVALKKDGVVILNGQEFPVERLHYKPYNPVSYIAGEMYIYPPAFPKPFNLELSCEKYSRQLTFSRVPNNSVNVAAFESERKQPLMASYTIDETKQTLSFNLSFNLSYAKSIRDIVETTFIYNAFAEGEGLFCGKSLAGEMTGGKFKKYDRDSMLFWEKVLFIEEKLVMNFKPPFEDVDFSTMCTVETLYQNLINEIPIRENKKIESIDGEWDMVSDSAVKDSVGKSIYFEFHATSHSSLFGVDFDLPCFMSIFDAKLKDYTVKGKKYKLLLENASEDKDMFTSILRFVNDNELTEYLEGNRDERISCFYNAKAVQEYLSI